MTVSHKNTGKNIPKSRRTNLAGQTQISQAVEIKMSIGTMGEDVPSNRARPAEPMRVPNRSTVGLSKVRLESPIVVAEEGMNEREEVHDLESVVIKLRPSSRMSPHNSDTGSETSGDSSRRLAPWSSRGRAPGGSVSMEI